MEHNDATDKDLPTSEILDPDATEIATMDLEALLHLELDAQREAQPRLPKTVPMLKAVPRASSRIPLSKSPIPRAPIHTLLPPAHRDEQDDEDDATCVFDRASVRSSVPSISVAFPAPNFSAPRAPLPFATIPAIPAAKKLAAHESQKATPVQQVTLPPTSRRELKVPSAFESLAPTSMYASFPPPPPSARKGSTLALVLTLSFAIASVIVMGLAVVRPETVARGKIAFATAMKGKQSKSEPAVATPIAAAQPAEIAVPPVLIESDEIAENQAVLIVPDSVKGHRVFVDGRAVSDGDGPIIVECGKKKIQLGSTGAPRLTDLPCGGGINLE